MSAKPRNDDNGKSSPLPQVDDCQGCGACCFHMGYPSYIEGSGIEGSGIEGSPTQDAEKYWVNLPEHLRGELVEYRNQYQHPTAGELDGPCFWYDPQTKLCKNHEHRPSVCRDFEVGSNDCVGWRKEYGIGEAAISKQP